MEKRRIQVHMVSLARVEIPQWFKDMTKEQQKEYLEQHPNSKISKEVKAEVKPAAKVSTIKTDENTKGKNVDPYKDVPEKDKKIMQEAIKRGYRVPPAWREVWLNPDPNADCQVKGRDSKGRIQSLYTVNFRQQQDAKKFNRLKMFATELPKVTNRLIKDLDKPEAQVLYLISKTGFRIGSSKETGGKVKAYGASTLEAQHVTINNDTIHFDFIGKEGVHQKHSIRDKRLAAILKDKSGRLFNTDEKKIHEYLNGISKNHYKVHDFRTYTGTATALAAMEKMDIPTDEKSYKKAILAVAKIVSEKLGNKPAQALQSYIDPTVFKNWKFEVDNAKNKEQSSTKAQLMKEYLRDNEYVGDTKKLESAMSSFLTNNVYQYPLQLIKLYQQVKSMSQGTARKEKYVEFQNLAKRMKMLNTSNKEEYLKSLRELESALKYA